MEEEEKKVEEEGKETEEKPSTQLTVMAARGSF